MSDDRRENPFSSKQAKFVFLVMCEDLGMGPAFYVWRRDDEPSDRKPDEMMFQERSERVWKAIETDTGIRLVTSCRKTGWMRLYVDGKFHSLLGRHDTPRVTQEHIAKAWLSDLGTQWLAATVTGETIKARLIYRQMWRAEFA